MKTSTSKQLKLAACALALAGVTGAAQAQQGFPGFSAPETRELWTEASKTQVWRSGYGLCWHSAFGPPPGYGECNPAPIAQYVAPVVVKPAPAPVIAPPPAPVIQPAPAPAPLPPRQTRG